MLQELHDKVDELRRTELKDIDTTVAAVAALEERIKGLEALVTRGATHESNEDLHQNRRRRGNRPVRRERVSKDNPRIEAYGAVDELNSAIGVARSSRPSEDIDAV